MAFSVYRHVVAAPSVPASSAQIDSAADYLTQNPNVARDIANAYIKSGMPLYSDPNLGAQSPATTFKSPLVETRGETDSIGNTKKDFGRTVVNLPAGPSSGPSAPRPDVVVETTSKTNGVPTGTVTSPLPFSLPTSSTSPKLPNSDLCADHPEILACANIVNTGDVPELELTKKDIQVGFSPVNVSSLASCPAPVVIPAAGLFGQKVIEFSLLCSWLGFLKPLILAFASLSSGMIVFVGRPYAAV